MQSGDVGARSAVVWARADRPAPMLVDVARTESFAGARTVVGPVTDEPRDLTAQLHLRGLHAGQDVFYRVRFADPRRRSRAGEPTAARGATS